MIKEVEVANTTQVEWRLPVFKGARQEIFGTFVFQSSDWKVVHRRHIHIQQTSKPNLFKVIIRDLESGHGLGKIVSSHNQQGSVFSVMCDMQDLMVKESTSLVEKSH